MRTDITLDEEEAKEAVRLYLREEKGMSVDTEDISFDIQRTSSQPGSIGSPRVKSVTCEDVESQ